MTAAIGILIFLGASIAAISAFPQPEVEVITQPKPGDEYVFVQSSGSGARPISRKDKNKDVDLPFETSHKFPASLTYALHKDGEEAKVKKPHKREAPKEDAPVPPPAGAIKLDVQKLLEKYKTELKTISTVAPRTTPTTTKASRRRTTNKRIKKEAKAEVTSPNPVLTTGAAAPKSVDADDIPLVASGSEKQRSRIQVKKGPNGQEYEYEYVYYYYDDEDDAKDNDKVHNSHDGPARNQITQAPKTKHPSTGATPEANEVVPSTSRGRNRGRQLGEEDTVGEERLPSNTRFPPRSRNLNTTPLPEEESKAARGRGRGRPTTEAAPSSEPDNVSDETQGSRGRTRANVRRPSLDLVDNASFNTHSNTAGAEPASSGPSFPTDLPAGPVRFLGATPNESVDPPEPVRRSEAVPETPSETEEEDTTEVPEGETTTVMSAMDKVALDLYAILQGTQKLSGEDAEASTEEDSTDATNETDVTTVEVTTEPVETTTPTTTTTTTTTTTPAPTTTTTTTTEAPVRGRFNKGRGRKTTHAASTTEAAPTETKPKGKFSRPSFGGRPKPGARTTPEPAAEKEVSKEEAKPVSHSRPTLSRGRFGGSRARPRTTAAPAEAQEESSSSSTLAPASRPSLTRPRASSFNLRTRGRTTAAPAESESSPAGEESSSSTEAIQTTARTRRIQAPGGGVRPLRPGPRLNIGARSRPGQTTTTTTTEAPEVEDHVTGDEDSNPSIEDGEEKAQEDEGPSAPVDNSPLGRLRNKHRPNIQVRPKAAASAPVQVRRINPLLARRRPGQTTEAASSEAPQESPSTEATFEDSGEDAAEDTAAPSSTTTTEEPRGLNKLLAGRRRLVRPGAHH